jgi:hypothetical protein
MRRALLVFAFSSLLIPGMLLSQTESVSRPVATSAASPANPSSLVSLHDAASRWLLMTHDQVRSDGFQETHEFLSHLLGTDRSEVTIAAGILRRAGLISYFRGKVKIEDRNGLEEASCECYKIISEESIRLREKRN